jgi:23S rRNA (cytidine1920-2'-O)/16S rRNA (cytidine1409-2'-O)-methyltransferase
MSNRKRVRLDVLLVERGLAPTRERAQAIILAGDVLIGDAPATKAGQSVDADAPVRLRVPDHPWASRGGLKLAHALDALGVAVEGRTALDVGASTGGFTDVLLARGARRVFAVDVGRGQLEARLRADARVVVLDGINARHLGREQIPEAVDVATVDVSFISLRLILPPVLALLAPGGDVLAMVKPQFEAGRGGAPGGVVRDEAARVALVDGIAAFARALGAVEVGRADSPIRGPKGNLETFLWLRLASPRAAGLTSVRAAGGRAGA